MRTILPYIILFSALTVSGSAAFYSVFGLSKLFAGASMQVIIMASSLEAAKLIIATLLHQYWNTINKLLRLYLTIATIILVIITSAGIYGFLSAAYQETANADKIMTRKIELLDTKQSMFEDIKNDYEIEKDELNSSISDLRKSLSNPNQVQYVDRETGQLVTTTSSSSRKSIENQLDQVINNRNDISRKLQTATDSISSLEIKRVEMLNDSDIAEELGPLKYISGLTGISMDRVVNWFLLTIIFVFDPLAIALILAANFAFNQHTKINEQVIIEKEPIISDEVENIEPKKKK